MWVEERAYKSLGVADGQRTKAKSRRQLKGIRGIGKVAIWGRDVIAWIGNFLVFRAMLLSPPTAMGASTTAYFSLSLSFPPKACAFHVDNVILPSTFLPPPPPLFSSPAFRLFLFGIIGDRIRRV